jgi:hypothetical protein
MATTTFTIRSQFDAAMSGGYQLTEADCALVAAVGTVAADGQFTREITALLDGTDAACERSADTQQDEEGRKPSPSETVSAVLEPFFKSPPEPRAAASILLGGAQAAWPVGRPRRLSAHPLTGDPRALPAYRRWATSLRTDTPSPQEAARCYAIAVRGWAKLMPRPPELDDAAADSTRAAWERYGAIIFWLHRPGITPDEASRQCAPHWQRLNADLLHAAADPLYWLETASQPSGEDEASVTGLMLRAFPDEVRPILEWSIQHPREAVSAFGHTWGDQAKALMRILAVVGDAGSREILREYADDAELGAAAIAAIRYLSSEQG